MFRILVDFGCETVRGNRLTAGSIVHNLCLVATSRLAKTKRVARCQKPRKDENLQTLHCPKATKL